MKEVNTQNLWYFELDTQEGIMVPIRIIVEIQQSDREHDQSLNNDTFSRLPVISVQCIIGTERYPDSAILLNYDDDDYFQGYGQIKEAFRALTKDDILQPHIAEHDFRSPNEGDNIGYNLYVFDTRYQKKFTASQPIKIEFNFSKAFDTGIYAYALVLTNEVVSIISDGQCHLDLI